MPGFLVPSGFVHILPPKKKIFSPFFCLANSYSSFQDLLTQVSSSLGSFLLTSQAYHLAKFGVSTRLHRTAVGREQQLLGVPPKSLDPLTTPSPSPPNKNDTRHPRRQ